MNKKISRILLAAFTAFGLGGCVTTSPISKTLSSNHSLAVGTLYEKLKSPNVLAEDKGELYVELSKSQRSLGQYAQALDAAEKALELLPENLEALKQLAWALHETGQFRPAIKEITKLISIANSKLDKSKSVKSALRGGYSAYIFFADKADKPDIAVSFLKNQLDTFPKEYASRAYYARSLALSGQKQQLVSFLRFQKHPGIYWDAAVQTARKFRYAEAVTYLEAGLKIHTSSKTQLTRTRFKDQITHYKEAGAIREAWQRYLNSIKKDGDDGNWRSFPELSINKNDLSLNMAGFNYEV